MEADGRGSSSSSASAGGGQELVVSDEEIDTLFPDWKINNNDSSLFLTALNTQISLSTFDGTAISTVGTLPGGSKLQEVSMPQMGRFI